MYEKRDNRSNKSFGTKTVKHTMNDKRLENDTIRYAKPPSFESMK